MEVVELKAAVPGLQGGPSTSAADIATTVTQALAGSASDLHIIVPPNSTELVLTGSPYSIKLAKELIEKLDHPQTMVALDYGRDVYDKRSQGVRPYGWPVDDSGRVPGECA